MKKMRKIQIDAISHIVCDRCSKVCSHDEPDFQSNQSIHFTTGNGSVFGDGREVSIDICEACLIETLGQWLKIESSPWLQNCIDLAT